MQPSSSYTVKANDNLTAIAKANNTDVNTLAKLNNISNVNLIKSGQVLNLPSIANTTTTVPSSSTASVPPVSVPKVITSNVINAPNTPNIPVTTPPAPVAPTTPPAPYNAADEAIKAMQVKDTPTQDLATNLSTQIYDLLPKLAGETQATADAYKAAGVDTLKADLQGINSQILKKQAELSQDDVTLVASMRNEERRDTLLPFAQSNQAKLAGDAAITRALKTSEIGVLNALALGKQGQIELATETAKDAVALKFAPYKEAISIYQAQLTALAPILSKDEKKQAAEQTLRGNIALKAIDKAQADQEKATELVLNLQKNGAPQSVINKAMQAKTVAEVQAIPSVGNYLLSQADRLDLALKGQALIKARNENSANGSNKILSVDDAIKLGVPYGTTQAQAAAMSKGAGGDVNTTVRAALQDKVNLIDKLSNSSGLSDAVGPNTFARIGFLSPFTGAKQDFIASTQQLTNQQTLDSLIALKKAGGTLGALNESEGAMLRDAATKINGWAVKDDAGQVIGYNIDEPTFKTELGTIKTLTNRALDAAGGPILTEAQKTDAYLNQVDSILKSSSSVYSNTGYNLK